MLSNGVMCSIFADGFCRSCLQIGDLAAPNAPASLNGNAPGVFVQGTLRMPREKLFEAIQTSLQQKFGECMITPLSLCSTGESKAAKVLE